MSTQKGWIAKERTRSIGEREKRVAVKRLQALLEYNSILHCNVEIIRLNGKRYLMSNPYLVNFQFLTRKSIKLLRKILLVNDSLNYHLLAVYLSRVVGNLGTLACIIATLYTTLWVEHILPYFSYMFDVPQCRRFLQTTLTLAQKYIRNFYWR